MCSPGRWWRCAEGWFGCVGGGAGEGGEGGGGSRGQGGESNGLHLPPWTDPLGWPPHPARSARLMLNTAPMQRPCCPGEGRGRGSAGWRGGGAARKGTMGMEVTVPSAPKKVTIWGQEQQQQQQRGVEGGEQPVALSHVGAAPPVSSRRWRRRRSPRRAPPRRRRTAAAPASSQPTTAAPPPTSAERAAQAGAAVGRGV